MPYAGKSPTDPARRRQLTAIFLSIQRRKGTAAAKAEYRKQQGEGYAPVAKDDKMKVKQKPKRKVKHGKASYADRRKAAELKRDPGDLVLTGKGTVAQERKRDPGEIYSRAGDAGSKSNSRAGASAKAKKRSKAKPNAKAPVGQGGRFAALEQRLQGQKGVTNPGALAASIGRRKYGKARFQKLGR